MKNKLKFLLFIVISFFIVQPIVSAGSTFQCEYTISRDSINVPRNGKVTCEMGQDSFLWIKTAILDCTFQAENKTEVWVNEHGTDAFNITDYLKNGGSECPKYISVQSSSASYEQGGYFKNGVHAYFGNSLAEVQQKSAEGGKYYVIGDLNGLENSEFNDMICNAMEDYEDLFDQLQMQINNFMANSCDKFALSEAEMGGVALSETRREYRKCKNYLTYTDTHFNSKLSELKSQYSEFKCLDKNDYDAYRSQLKDYQKQFKELTENLEKSFNGSTDVPDENDDDDNNNNNNNGGAVISNPDYKVDDSATLANTCSSSSFRKPMKFIGIIINFVKIIVPIIIIAFGVLDLYKAVTASKDDGFKKAVRSIAIRVIAGVFIFLLPGIIQFVLNMVNEWSDYKNVWCCCTDCLLNPDCDTDSCSSDSCHIEGTN